MASRQTSQWEFEGLFGGQPSPANPVESANKPIDEAVSPRSPAPAKPPRTWTVQGLTRQIASLLEDRFQSVRVSGEISNFRLQGSGHCYFTLKDQHAQLSCVLFRGERVSFRDQLAQGVRLILTGDISLYAPRGQYQLIVRAVELDGVGSLQLAFEAMKAKLKAEGLFDAARKRRPCPYPETVGLVTSASGAALKDVLHVFGRRHPGLKLILAPCRVQGQGAAAEIARALGMLNQWHASCPPGKGLDLILMTRGGGSLEDLWAFNEEQVARAIAASQLPVISAVGHEIDFTISDFVADIRAATPSAAAELISEGAVRASQRLHELAQRMGLLLNARMDRSRQYLNQLGRRLDQRHPKRVLEGHAQHLDQCQQALHDAMELALEKRRHRMQALGHVMRTLHPARQIQRNHQQMCHLASRWQHGLKQQWQQMLDQWRHLGATLHLLGPIQTLARGYSITTDSRTGKVLRSVQEIPSIGRITTQLADGTFEATPGQIQSETNPK
jgi:exodeoxyribonuclease VII large subunit